jgi:hypothetical protein
LWDSGTQETSGLQKVHFPVTFKQLKRSLLTPSEQLRCKLALLRIYLIVISVETLIYRSTVSGAIERLVAQVSPALPKLGPYDLRGNAVVPSVSIVRFLLLYPCLHSTY